MTTMSSVIMIASERSSHFASGLKSENTILWGVKRSDLHNNLAFQRQLDRLLHAIDNSKKRFKGAIVDLKCLQWDYYTQLSINAGSFVQGVSTDEWKKIQARLIEIINAVSSSRNIERDNNGRALIYLQNFVNYLDIETATNEKICNRFMSETTKLAMADNDVKFISSSHFVRVLERFMEKSTKDRKRRELTMAEYFSELDSQNRSHTFNKLVNEQHRRLRAVMNKADTHILRTIEVILLHQNVDLYIQEKMVVYNFEKFGAVSYKRGVDGRNKAAEEVHEIYDENEPVPQEVMVTREEIDDLKLNILARQEELVNKQQKLYSYEEKKIKKEIESLEKERYIPSEKVTDLEKTISNKKHLKANLSPQDNIEAQIMDGLENTITRLEAEMVETRRAEIDSFETMKNGKIVIKNHELTKLQEAADKEDQDDIITTPILKKIEAECGKVVKSFQEQDRSNQLVNNSVMDIYKKIEELKTNKREAREFNQQMNTINILEQNKVEVTQKLQLLQKAVSEKIGKIKEADETIKRLKQKVEELEAEDNECEILDHENENEPMKKKKILGQSSQAE